MQAIQFETAISDGIISIPKEYYNKLLQIINVIILSKNIQEQGWMHYISANLAETALSSFGKDKQKQEKRS
jgi:hypothetical protein